MKKNTSTLHLTGLNGLRAIAALGVLVSHLSIELEKFRLNLLFGRDSNGYPSAWQLATFGVYIFFALSGFLITYLLLLEKEKRPVDIKQFYLRRILRIWPLYFFYLALVFLTYWLYKIFYANTLPYYIFFMANVPYLIQRPLPLATHYWSLAVEEQFYLFWPWLIKAINKNLLAWLTGLVLLTVMVKLFFHFGLHKSFSQTIIDAFPFHCMMMGGIGAVLYQQQNKLFLKIATNTFTQIAAWLAFAFVMANHFHVASILDKEIISCSTVLIIVAQITRRNRVINLERKGFDFFGKISFGIYIYHPLMIYLLAQIIGPLNILPFPKYVLAYASVIIVTVLVAQFSYRFLESYFLRLKDKFSVTHTVPNKSELNLKASL